MPGARLNLPILLTAPLEQRLCVRIKGAQMKGFGEGGVRWRARIYYQKSIDTRMKSTQGSSNTLQKSLSLSPRNNSRFLGIVAVGGLMAALAPRWR